MNDDAKNNVEPYISISTFLLIHLNFFLSSYLKLYGFKFSKDDHVELVKLLLKIIQIKNLDPSKLNKYVIS